LGGKVQRKLKPLHFEGRDASVDNQAAESYFFFTDFFPLEIIERREHDLSLLGEMDGFLSPAIERVFSKFDFHKIKGLFLFDDDRLTFRASNFSEEFKAVFMKYRRAISSPSAPLHGYLLEEKTSKITKNNSVKELFQPMRVVRGDFSRDLARAAFAGPVE
jgi:hypothetical protein